MAKKMKEQGTIADLPLRSTTKVYYIRVENGMPSGDEGWVTVDEAKRMNATDRRTHGQPMNRYFQDQQSAQNFSSNPPGGGMPSDAMPPEGAPMDDMGMGEEPPLGEEPVDDFGAGLPDDGMGGMPGDEMDTGIGEEPVDDFGDGLDDMGMDDMGDLGGEEDALGDLGGDDLLGDLEDEEEEPDFELVVPRRVRLVPAKESLDMTGLADKDDVDEDDVCPKQLAMGIKVEMEHTKDEDVARQIALDHLTEIPDYYTRLKRMEQDAEESIKGGSFAGLVEAFKGGPFGPREPEAHEEPDDKKTRRARRKGRTNSPEWRKARGLPKGSGAQPGPGYNEAEEPEVTTEVDKCKYCGAGVQNGLCSQCRRLQGDQPKADFRDEPHNGTKKHMRRRGESRSTEEGIIEALINGDCTVEEAIKEQTMGTAGQVGFNQRDQSILGRQVALNTQVKQPQIPWGQPQQQQTQLPPDIQPLYDQYMQALQSGDQMQADKLKQNLVWELQVAGIDPTTVGIR